VRNNVSDGPAWQYLTWSLGARSQLGVVGCVRLCQSGNDLYNGTVVEIHVYGRETAWREECCIAYTMIAGGEYQSLRHCQG